MTILSSPKYVRSPLSLQGHWRAQVREAHDALRTHRPQAQGNGTDRGDGPGGGGAAGRGARPGRSLISAPRTRPPTHALWQAFTAESPEANGFDAFLEGDRRRDVFPGGVPAIWIAPTAWPLSAFSACPAVNGYVP